MNGAKGRKHKRRREKEDERSPINRLDARFEPSTGSDDETKEKVVEWRRRGAPPSVFQMVRYCATATPHRGSFRQSGLGRRQRQYDGARADRLGSEAPSILAVRATNIKHLIPQFPSPNLPSQPNHHLIQRIRSHSPNPVVESANVCQCLPMFDPSVATCLLQCLCVSPFTSLKAASRTVTSLARREIITAPCSASLLLHAKWGERTRKAVR